MFNVGLIKVKKWGGSFLAIDLSKKESNKTNGRLFRHDKDIDPDSMIGQCVSNMVGAIVSLALLDELLEQMKLARVFKEKGYVLFNVRM